MKVLKYANYLYTAITAVFLAALISRAVEYNLTEPHPMPPLKTAASRTNQPSQAQIITAITERNLFDVDKAEPIAESSASIASAAVLDIPFSAKLTGILLAKIPADSIAIITTDKDVYVLNTLDEQDGYKLKSATFDTAVVLYNGREHTLGLDNTTTLFAAPPPPEPQVTPEITPPPAPASPALSAESTLQFSLQRGEVIDQLKDMNTLVRSLQISPLFNGAEYQGYRVTKMDENSPAKQLGLQQGDVIIRVNGTDLQDGPKPLFDMMNKIDEISVVTIDVTRNGEKKTLFVEIQ